MVHGPCRTRSSNTTRQVYINVNHHVLVCREMQILSCPVTGFQEKRNQFLASSFAVKESILSPWLCVVVAPLFLRAASMCVSIRRVHRYLSRRRLWPLYGRASRLSALCGAGVPATLLVAVHSLISASHSRCSCCFISAMSAFIDAISPPSPPS